MLMGLAGTPEFYEPVRDFIASTNTVNDGIANAVHLLSEKTSAQWSVSNAEWVSRDIAHGGLQLRVHLVADFNPEYRMEFDVTFHCEQNGACLVHDAEISDLEVHRSLSPEYHYGSSRHR